jgi:hypothetical protein
MTNNGTTRLGAIRKNHATVHTTTVDVKIMRLAKKQVTMSVFRQLDEKSIFREGKLEPSLRGVPWGRVNYTWGENQYWADYHIVWQRNDRLFRMGLPLVENFDNHCNQVHTKGQRFFRQLDLSEAWKHHKAERNAERNAERRRQYEEQYEAWRQKQTDSVLEPSAPSDLDSDYLIEVDPKLTRSFGLYVDQLETFENLDQLFIAV